MQNNFLLCFHTFFWVIVAINCLLSVLFWIIRFPFATFHLLVYSFKGLRCQVKFLKTKFFYYFFNEINLFRTTILCLWWKHLIQMIRNFSMFDTELRILVSFWISTLHGSNVFFACRIFLFFVITVWVTFCFFFYSRSLLDLLFRF